MDREVSLPFAPPSPAPARRAIERAESSTLRLEMASVLEQRADDIAARWWGETRVLLPAATISTDEGAPASPDTAPLEQGVALVRGLAAALVGRDDVADEVMARGVDLGTAAFAGAVTLPRLLHALDQLAAICFDVIEDALRDRGTRVEVSDAMQVCRALVDSADSVKVAASRGFVDAADHALHERFRRLRHDLRNPIATIRSALSLMADETVPEEARRGPRFPTMIERNATALDQLVVTRLGDAEARLVPAAPRDTASPSVSHGVGEPGHDLARARERDDRQAGSF